MPVIEVIARPPPPPPSLKKKGPSRLLLQLSALPDLDPMVESAGDQISEQPITPSQTPIAGTSHSTGRPTKRTAAARNK